MADYTENTDNTEIDDILEETDDEPISTLPRRRLRSTAVLPASFTLLNGLLGFAAIYYASKSGFGVTFGDSDAAIEAVKNLKIASLLIFGAMIFDMLDGRVARMTRTTSDFGAQLDSLCDMVSFGVAPAMLTLHAAISILRTQFERHIPVERVVWCIAAIYVACAVLRLARFNVETEQDESAHMDFRGLPTPAAAAGLGSMVLLFTSLMKDQALVPESVLLIGMSVTLPILTLVCALLMVSQFTYPHLVNHYIRGRKPFSYLVKMVVVILLLVMFEYQAMAVLVLAYILMGPAISTFKTLRRQKA
ncbi:MAG: CDP-diacylglycerol--serine O-phosphatidyltransferase [Phycisphaerae bacterium]|nr:CDP-diacylglycerol--serine O-phosphatidyltransferase [Phycisphaerae bacterium]